MPHLKFKNEFPLLLYFVFEFSAVRFFDRPNQKLERRNEKLEVKDVRLWQGHHLMS